MSPPGERSVGMHKADIGLHDVGFAYPGAPALMRGVSLSVAEGEMLAVLGPNGSGKTTLLRLLAGRLRAAFGRIEVCGMDPVRADRRAFAREVAVVGPQPELGFTYTVVEVVLMGRAPHLDGFRLETDADLAAADRAMRATGIGHLAERRFDALSSGERQRVSVARALAQEPRVLLLDEPAAHLDIKQQIVLHETLRMLREQRGLTIISVLHDLNIAALYFDRVALMRDGELFACGTPEATITYENVRTVFDTDVYVDLNDLTGKLNVLPLPTKRQ